MLVVIVSMLLLQMFGKLVQTIGSVKKVAMMVEKASQTEDLERGSRAAQTDLEVVTQSCEIVYQMPAKVWTTTYGKCFHPDRACRTLANSRCVDEWRMCQVCGF
jgi:hypothetical protein